jgi:carbon storage regulator CsrA
MLVLSRRSGESLILETSDGLIEVSISQVSGSQTKVAILAPQTVRISRRELLDKRGTG